MLGEGADKCILREVIGVASVKEIGFELDGMAEEIGTVGADPTYTQELAIGETLVSVEGVAGLKSEVVVGICGFGVKFYPQCAVRFQVDHGVKEGEVGGRDFEGKFDGGVAGVKVVNEGKEGHEAMLPDEEDVIYEPFPQEGKKVVCVDGIRGYKVLITNVNSRTLWLTCSARDSGCDICFHMAGRKSTIESNSSNGGE